MHILFQFNITLTTINQYQFRKYTHTESWYAVSRIEMKACEITLKTLIQSKLDTVGSIRDIVFSISKHHSLST